MRNILIQYIKTNNITDQIEKNETDPIGENLINKVINIAEK